jgi:nitronate monooxygenase
MSPWPDARLCSALGIQNPVLLAPMAGAGDATLAIAAARGGALAAIPAAMLSVDVLEREVMRFRAATGAAIHLNFFSHRPQADDAERTAAWRLRLTPYYQHWGIDPQTKLGAAQRRPFDTEACAAVERLRPQVVSFHFGLPETGLLERVRACGARILSSATTVAEARWLDARGVDAIIAQGSEAGGHRDMFLTDDAHTQIGGLALIPQIVDAVSVPVIAAGGIGDARGMAAAFALGASGVQLGTAFLWTPEAMVAAVHRAALQTAADDQTALTNLFSGRPARGIVNRLMREQGPLRNDLPPFPTAGAALAPLRAKAEPEGLGDFQSLWAGQAFKLGREEGAEALARRLIAETLERLGR